MKEFVTLLSTFDYVAKDTEPSSSGEEDKINLLIQESSESNTVVAKAKKEEKTSYG